MMGPGGIRDELDEACDEHARLTLALAAARSRQEEIVARFLDGMVPRLAEVAGDLSFGFERARACGVALARGPGVPPLFLIAREESWLLIERRAHGVHAVVDRLAVGALLDAFGRDSLRVVAAALQVAQVAQVAAETKAAEAARASAAPAARAAPASSAGPAGPRARAAEVRARTRDCPHCDAQPNAENYARHLGTVHGLAPDGRARKRSSSATHEVCRLCGARLPAGRLDPHLTAAHGVFHVHPRGESLEERRAAAIRDARRAPGGMVKGPAREGAARLNGSLVHASSSGRDFLGEARLERGLIARADSPLRNRERSGRFSDAPDVERMDGDSEA